MYFHHLCMFFFQNSHMKLFHVFLVYKIGHIFFSSQAYKYMFIKRMTLKYLCVCIHGFSLTVFILKKNIHSIFLRINLFPGTFQGLQKSCQFLKLLYCHFLFLTYKNRTYTQILPSNKSKQCYTFIHVQCTTSIKLISLFYLQQSWKQR